MQIKFEGQNHQIDANTLVNVLIHYNNLIEIINKEYGQGEKKISLRVNAIEKGSFVIDVSPVENLVQSLFSSEGVAYISSVIAITEGVYQLYKWRKGKPIDSKEDKDNVENIIKSGDTIINAHTVNIYNLQQSREAISKSIETANQDQSVEGISYSFDGKEEKIEYKKTEFEELIYTDFDTEKDVPNENEEIVDATLVITKLSFEKGATWQFLYNGFKISLVVKDDALMKHIDNGARFAKGDAIKVKMKIVKRYNAEYNAYENKGYKILEFMEHIVAQRPNQGKLF